MTLLTSVGRVPCGCGHVGERHSRILQTCLPVLGSATRRSCLPNLHIGTVHNGSGQVLRHQLRQRTVCTAWGRNKEEVE